MRFFVILLFIVFLSILIVSGLEFMQRVVEAYNGFFNALQGKP